MKYLLPITFIVLTSFQAKSTESIVVLANTQETSIKLSRQEVRNLFMGGAVAYDLTAVALPPNNQTRVLFNTKVVGLTESRIQSYWAQMRFSGRKKPPTELVDESNVLEHLKNTPGAIGYLPAGVSIPDNLHVVFSTD